MWTRGIALQLEPLVILSESSSGYWTLGPNEENQTWSWENFEGAGNWSAPDCPLPGYGAGGDCDTYSTSFYQRVNGAWQDVTASVLPKISIRSFLGQSHETELPFDFDADINWDFELPQRGTRIIVKPVALDELICFGDRLPARNPNKAYEKYSDMIENRMFENAQLIWDRNAGKFRVGTMQKRQSQRAH